MKGGKDEKIMGPLFPRLHINDAESGGPKAPPRNKMALYEQLSTPSQNCSTGQASLLPLPPNNSSILVPSVPSSQRGEDESTVFPSFYIPPPTPAYSNDKLHPLSYDALFMNTLADLEQKSMKTSTYPSLTDSMDLSWATEYGSLQPQDLSNIKNAYGTKHAGEDNFMVPGFVHSKNTESFSEYPNSIDREIKNKSGPSQPGCSTAILGNSMPRPATKNFSSSMQRNSRDKQLKKTNTTDLTSRQHRRNHNEGNLKESLSNKEMQKLESNSTRKENASESFKPTNASLNQDHHSSPVQEGVKNIDSRLHQEYKARFLSKCTAGGNGVSVDSEKTNVPRDDTESCARASLWNDHRTCNEAENDRNYCSKKAQRSSQVQNVDRNDDSSGTSMMDSTSGFEISPVDVVGAIGQKHFWKVRRELVDQQRLFAVQVFELHRLIKVQRMIAGSPNLLLEDPYFSKPSLNKTPKKLPSEPVIKSSPQIKAKDVSQRSKQRPESAVGTSSPRDDLKKKRGTQSSSYSPYARYLLPKPVATENTTISPWYLHQSPGNQWLLPIMSPTEGLVYKPISGAFLPTAGVMAPIYGGWGPMAVPSMAGGYLNPAFGFSGPAPVTPLYPSVMNVINSSSPFHTEIHWLKPGQKSNLRSYQKRR